MTRDRLETIPYQNIIRVSKNPRLEHVLDVELDHLDRLRELHSVECHIVCYPYALAITSDTIVFTPFEEYAHDIAAQQRSAYTPIHSYFSRAFGIMLGLTIILLVYLLKPADLFSVSSLVSIIGAYLIAKELWGDLERFFINSSKRRRLRYTEDYYSFVLEKDTTLTRYSALAKRRRYGKACLLPEKMAFIEQSNSQTVRMFFNMKDLSTVSGTSAHILSIVIDPDLMPAFEAAGAMIGVKISLNTRCGLAIRSLELFQSLDRGRKGCMTESKRWVTNAIFFRRTARIGRLKHFRAQGTFPGSLIGAQFGSAIKNRIRGRPRSEGFRARDHT